MKENTQYLNTFIWNMNVEFSDGHETYLSAGGGVWASCILEVATKLRESRKFC